ncbi:MAG: hypothetical protein A2287_00655 [Candidatus Melainabacteria bacterium RIFOXYA12_FULL_32_12]|nr:MAG: hypothetical protein A2255_10560 [Candidatus Melainabacteria bacterium RIFOXYA2_FULL_32_9]OGI29149.1 MAG: hypothetical protein A2287_00655 [Candidatus Melainabacteria bacterium RIFOXYA12_FULL_32_12]
MSIFENNIKRIKEYNPVLADKLQKYSFNENAKFELVTAESGDPNLIYNGIWVHDIKNPQQEASNVFGQFKNTSESSINIITGLGLGYLFKRYFLSSKGKIIVYEPSLDILKFTLEIVDFSVELEDKRVHIANTHIELMKSLEEVFVHKDLINISGLNSSYTLYPQEISILKKDLSQIINHLEANYITLFQKSVEWVSQGLQNIPQHINNYNIDALRSTFSTKPAVIVSSGPSLDKTIESLAQYRDKVIIFCVANAYKTLTKYNIKPDFITFIEVDDTSPQVKELDISDINMIILSVANAEIYKLDFKRKFIFYSNNDLYSRWISDIAGFSVENYQNKGTVSYCALYSAFMMGCNPIILLGQDLAYSANQCYSSDSAFGSIKFVKDEITGEYKVELDNIEEFKKFYIERKHTDEFTNELIKIKLDSIKSNLTFVRGQNGDMLPTDANYAGFIKYFEHFAYEHSNPNSELQLINSSTGGAQIDGFKNVGLKEVLENLPTLEINVDSKIDQILTDYKEPVKEHIVEITRQVKYMAEEIGEFLILAQDALNKSEQLLLELKKDSFNVDRIRILASNLMEFYIKFQGELFDKYQVLINCVFKELLELSKLMESETNNSLEDLVNMAQTSKNFYDTFLKQATYIKSIAEMTLNKHLLEYISD